MNKFELKRFNEQINRIINEDVLKRVKDKKDAIKLKEEEDWKNSQDKFLDEVIQKLKKEDYLNKRFKKLNIEVGDIFEQGRGDYLMELYDSNNKAGVLLFINIVKGRIDFYLMLVYIDQEERIMEEIFGLSFDDMSQEDDFDKIIKIIERFFGQAKAKEVEKKLDDFFEDNYDEIVKEVEKSKNESRKLRRNSLRRKSEKVSSDYDLVEGLVYNILGEVGEEDGQFKIYADNVSAKVYFIKNGRWDKTVAQARNLKELISCLESIRLYKDFKGIK